MHPRGRVLLVAWYAPRRRLVQTAGARVSVVDLRDPDAGAVPARAARPAAPSRSARPGTGAVHAGGIAVVGGWLYVADTRAGVRLFRLDDVVRAPTGELVLPELVRVRQRALPGGAPLRWSFFGVARDGGRLSLVAGEYGRAGTTPRLARYPLDDATGLPALDASGSWMPLEVHERQPHRMQGVAVHEGTWVLTSSTGEGNPGDLYVGARAGGAPQGRAAHRSGGPGLVAARRGAVVRHRVGRRRWFFPVRLPIP